MTASDDLSFMSDLEHVTRCRKLLDELPPDQALRTVRTLRKRLRGEDLEKQPEEEIEKKLEKEPEIQPEALESEAETEKKLEEEQDTQHEVSFHDEMAKLFSEAYEKIVAKPE